MRKKNNGFTLIELLAIIVILAIIAVITIPVILNVIENARRGAAIDSAYNYKDAIYKSFLTELSSNQTKPLPTGTYVIDGNGVLVNADENLVVNVSGTEPSEFSWVELLKGEVVAYSLKLGDYVVTKYQDTEPTAVKNGDVAENAAAREARLELERQTNAKDLASSIASSVQSNHSGETGIFEITEGWVALVNGNVVGYSLKENIESIDYIVTSDVTVTAEKGTTIADVSSNINNQVVLAQATSYVSQALTKYSDLTDEAVKNVSTMTSEGLTKPSTLSEGWIQFAYDSSATPNVSTADYSLKFGDYVVNNGTVTTGNVENQPIIVAGTTKTDGYKYLTTPVTVYYNPTTASTCESSSASSATGTTTGCLKWYAYSVKDGIVNMILDHNINPSGTGVAWVSSTDYGNSATLGASLGVTNMGSGSYGSYGNNDKGPLTALNYLKTNTSSWTTSVSGDYATYTAGTSNSTYSIDYSGYKARLITAQEVAYIKGASWNETTATSAISSLPSWLYENLSSTTGLYGYWSSSPNAGYSYDAWNVGRDGGLGDCSVNFTIYGVRPVITVSTSVVFS